MINNNISNSSPIGYDMNENVCSHQLIMRMKL